MVGGVPKYRLHKASGLAVVTLYGKDNYLGRYGSDSSRAMYMAKVAEWEADGRPSKKLEVATIVDLAGRYLEHAKRHYVKRGRQTGTYGTVARICEFVTAMYGKLEAPRFGVLQFKAVRHQWIKGVGGRPGVSRKTANQYSDQLREMFRWGVEAGLVPVTTLQEIKAVRSLEKGRSEAPERAPIKPAPIRDVEAVKPLVHRRVRAKIELQLLTGMRPGEVCSIRTCDIDRSGEIWIYRPSAHKTEHHNKDRVIPLGPKARAILKTFLDVADPRRTILVRPSSRRKFIDGLASPDGMVRSYRASVVRACEVAGVPAWHPNQLRHNAATELRRRFGIEAAQLALGHSSASTTEIYAERDLDAASRIAAEVG